MAFNPGRRIETRIRRHLDKIKTIAPGVVSDVHKDKLMVDVFIKTVKSERPVHINEVRVLYPQSNTSKFLFNIERGDTVMLLFSKHSLKALQNEDFINVRRDDRFNVEDVVALPGIQLDKYIGEKINNHNIEIPDGISILCDNKIFISGESIELENVDNIDFSDGTSLDSSAFSSLDDTPDDYEGSQNKVVTVKEDETGLNFTDVGEIKVDEFIELLDTPNDYSGHGEEVLMVNEDENAVIFNKLGLDDLNPKDHDLLDGLSDDDHLQYLNRNGVRSMEGDLDMGDNRITDLLDPINNQDGTTKKWVEDNFNDYELEIHDIVDMHDTSETDTRNLLMPDGSGNVHWTNGLLNIGDTEYKYLQDLADTTISSGIFYGCIVTDNGDGSVNVTDGFGFIRDEDYSTSNIYFMDIDGDNFDIPIDERRWIGVDYNEGDPELQLWTNDDWNGRTNFPVAIAYNENGTIYVTNHRQRIGDQPHLISRRLHNIRYIERAQGLLLGADNRYVTLTSGELWVKFEETVVESFDSSTDDVFDRYYRDGTGGWIKESDESQWNNTYYDDGSGTLQEMNNGRYNNCWFYITSEGDVVSIYGRENESNLASAEDANPPVNLPKRLDRHSLLLGRFIIKKNESEPEEIQSSFIEPFTQLGVTEHDDLGGITTSNHHSYPVPDDGLANTYLYTDGTRSMDGDLDMDETDNYDIVNIGSIDVNDTGNFQEANLKIRIYDGEEEPDVPDDSIAMWDDGTSLWLIYNKEGANKMVELT